MSIFIIPVETLSQSMTLASLIALPILYLLYLTVYRLLLSPIAHFPGPKLAAWTYWYEFWYDVVAEPEYTFKIGRLHEEYGSSWPRPSSQSYTDHPQGPIIRINPDEIHIADPDFYDTVYAGSGRKRDKWDWITRSFGVDESLIGTLGHDEHRVRRAALSPYFSKQSVRALQPLIDRNMAILLERLREFAVSGTPMKLDDAYAALTNDIVEYYAFGRSEHRLQAPDFDPSFRDAMLQGGKAGHVLKHFPSLMDMLRKLPDSLLLKLSPAMGAYSQLQTGVKRQVAEIQLAHQTQALILLESLPFLTGVVQEGVRLSHAISHRLHRICPDETLVYRSGEREWHIPSGTPLSMTSNLVHHDERVFPDSHAFKPERWVGNPRLDRYLVSFGKGGRACLGINLAYAELYLTLAALFRVYGTAQVHGKDDVGTLGLFETTAADLVITSGTIVPVMPEDSKGLRVRVHPRSK
ncbi:cytochrome P450 [Colletotrichum tofieldiae]|nr:cytochrome P450 [Colletotrichum tofieldiae]